MLRFTNKLMTIFNLDEIVVNLKPKILKKNNKKNLLFFIDNYI